MIQNESHFRIYSSLFPFYIMLRRIKSSYPQHHHSFYEFSFVVDGFLTEVINGQSFKLQRGSVTLKQPHQVHQVISHETEYEKFTLSFDMDVLMKHSTDRSIAELFLHGEKLPSMILLSELETQFMENLCSTLLSEYSGNQPYKQSLIKSKLTEVLIFLARFQHKDGSIKHLAPIITDRLVWEIVQYIAKNYWETLQLREVALRFNRNPTYISKLFKQHLGQNFISFLHDVRIHHACGLLISSEMSITDISAEVGFESFKTFSRVFKILKGISPSEYRRTKILL